jgi:hypothetical protein
VCHPAKAKQKILRLRYPALKKARGSFLRSGCASRRGAAGGVGPVGYLTEHLVGQHISSRRCRVAGGP